MLYIAASGYLGTQFKGMGGISSARDVALDRAGNLYATTGQYIRKVTSDGKVTTVAGSGATPYFGGDNGPATAARLHAPSGLAVDDSGAWYAADTANNRIRKITPGGIITTIAGTGDAGSKGDNGPAVLAQLNGPRSVAIDSQHNIYIADSGNNGVRKITPGGMILTAPVQVKDPEYIAVDSQDSLYVADTGNSRVLKMTSAGLVSTLMLVLQPSAVTVDHNGNVYVSGVNAVSKITPAGSISPVLDGLNSPPRVGIHRDGRPDHRRCRRERCPQAVANGHALYHRWNGRRWFFR
jgi:sugar lactone lactonase YvrE